jgi:hypothetical protein
MGSYPVSSSFMKLGQLLSVTESGDRRLDKRGPSLRIKMSDCSRWEYNSSKLFAENLFFPGRTEDFQEK